MAQNSRYSGRQTVHRRLCHTFRWSGKDHDGWFQGFCKGREDNGHSGNAICHLPLQEGKLSEAKELYTQIRLKPKDRENYLQSLEEDGILYVEVRSIDINPFEKSGISKQDAEFVHLFLIYLLLLEENKYENWQEEGLYNGEIVAEKGFNPNTRLKRNGEKIKIQKWANQILDNIETINTTFNLEKENLIKNIRERINNQQKTHAKQLQKIVENKGYIPSQISIAKHNKETSKKLIDLETIYNNKELTKYYEKGLPEHKNRM